MAKKDSKRNPAFGSKFKTLVKDVKILRRSSNKDAVNGVQHHQETDTSSSQHHGHDHDHDHYTEPPLTPLDLEVIPSNRDQDTIASSQDPAVVADLQDSHQTPPTSTQNGDAVEEEHDEDDDHGADVEVLESEDLSEEPAWSTGSEESDDEQEPEKPGLSVQLSLNFQGAMGFSCDRTYDSAIDFEASERLMRGLLRRIDHGCFELITRTDPNATKSAKGKGKEKPLRFEMVFNISQKGTVWATRTYKSYQQEPVTIETVKEIAGSSHRLIGLFIRRHDPKFVWKDGPIRDEAPEEPQTSPYHFRRVQPMTCIPRSRFLEDSQKFEAVPGFSLEIKLTSRRRKHPDWVKALKLNSKQSTPLNLAVAEALFFDASYEVETAFRTRRGAVEDRHRSSCGLAGGSCPHYDDKATEITLKMSNNIGPEFTHLERTIHSNLGLFAHADNKDSVEFVKTLEHTLREARDTADQIIGNMNDLEFRIVQLKGKGWVLDKPLVFTVGPSNQLSRHTVKAILERVQVGVADALQGAAVMVRMTASKRGHFILDKTLIVRALSEDGNPVAAAAHQSRKQVVGRVKRRIQEDMDMICKDTCSLDNLDDSAPSEVKHTGPAMSSKSDLANSQAASLHPPKTPNSESHRSSVAAPSSPSATRSPHTLATASPVKSEFSERSESAPMYRTKSGTRAFPLIPTPTSYGFPESPKPELKRQKTPSMEHESHPHHPQVPNRTSSRSLSKPKQSEGDDASLAPSTPSLVSADGHSTQSSSVVFTPKSHDKYYHTDEHLAAKGIADARSMQKHGFATHPRNRPPPSPLHQHEETRVGEDRSPKLALFPKPPVQPTRAAPQVPTPTSADTVTAADQEAEPVQVTLAPVGVASGEGLRRHSDSGMNPVRAPMGFDFSSPWPSPPLDSNEWEEAVDDSPERSGDRTLVARSSASGLNQPTTPKSNMFGSAGLLGFRREPQVIGVGLRRALIASGGGTPKSLSFLNHMQHARHASLFMKPSDPYADVELMKRPASSSGKELGLVHINMDNRRLRKSASVAVLGDMVLMKQPSKDLDSKDSRNKSNSEESSNKGDKERSNSNAASEEKTTTTTEKKRARSSSWMFLRALG